MKLRFNTNFIAAGLLAGAYIASAIHFFIVSAETAPDSHEENTGARTVRVTHWQLEPGFREGLQWAIDQYNELPHVKEAGVEVLQLPISERVYRQFLNVHLISGTAPDIAAKGQTNLTRGNGTARFFSALGEYVNEPNPYNADQYLDPSLPEETRAYLKTSPWKDTFIDGMIGGYDNQLNDYYAVPVATFGSLRLFYNGTILKEVKEFILQAIAKKPQPSWLQSCWIQDLESGRAGFLPDNARLRDWLESSHSPPQTLGQLILYCEAVKAYAKAKDLQYLVPISGSNYRSSNLAIAYEPIFLSHKAEQLDMNPGTGVSAIESIAGWQAGIWSFDSQEYVAYLDFVRQITSFFPKGFLGLDREQAQRRFILGKAALISSGGWDASGIFAGAATRETPEDRFEVIVTAPPMPAPDERWHKYLPRNRSEAAAKAGVPLAINKQSPNFDWALDFLRFLSSHPINEEYTRRAAWLPSIVGTKPVEQMKPFAPLTEGIPTNTSYSLRSAGGGLRNVFTGQEKLFMAGDISRQEMIANIETYINDPQVGLNNYWFREWQRMNDQSRARDRTIAAEKYKAQFLEDEKAARRSQSLFYDSLTYDEGTDIRLMWQKYNPETAFPEK